MNAKLYSANRKGRNRLGHPGVDGRIILKCAGVEWIHVAQDRHPW
jgi:hypothetical protein